MANKWILDGNDQKFFSQDVVMHCIEIMSWKSWDCHAKVSGELSSKDKRKIFAEILIGKTPTNEGNKHC